MIEWMFAISVLGVIGIIVYGILTIKVEHYLPESWNFDSYKEDEIL